MPEQVPSRRASLALESIETTAFGSGFISGLASAVLGLTAFGLVLALRFPQLLGYAELRPLHFVASLRVALHLMLVAAFLLGSVSAVLRTNKTLALTGLGTTLAAALFGGSAVVTGTVGESRGWLGVDFFVLNLFVYSAVFVPLERLFALRTEQPVFRHQWLVDLSYFFVNSLLIEVLTLATLQPAAIFFSWAQLDAVRTSVSTLPLLVQVPALLLTADFTQYWVHRAFHRSRWLWPFHAIHHSIEQMDWLAGSRLHLVDVVVTRGLTYVPVFVLGFSEPALMVYVFVVAAQATFIHANVHWTFRRWQRFVATPAFHHWHHSAEPQSVDKNFAVHTPLWDLAFGTYYLPDRWPSKYGLVHGRVPAGWLAQFAHPWRLRATGQLPSRDGH